MFLNRTADLFTKVKNKNKMVMDAINQIPHKGIPVTAVNIMQHEYIERIAGVLPGEYVKNTAVKSLLDSEGVDCLPIVFVGDEVLSKGDYPSRAELLASVSIKDDGAQAASDSGGAAEKTASSCCG